MLWFDVGIKRYTTIQIVTLRIIQLWFDVGIKRYTTRAEQPTPPQSCGLMQESKDIQLKGKLYRNAQVVV